jgi:hypothetical protein
MLDIQALVMQNAQCSKSASGVKLNQIYLLSSVKRNQILPGHGASGDLGNF